MRALVVFTAALVFLGGCAHFPENQRLDRWTGRSPLLALSAPSSSRELVVLLAFSGGGTRAAALAYGVLEELRETWVEVASERRRLLHEVDLISGVSGGSFTAAYYGLFGEGIFEDFEERFLRRNVQGILLRRLFLNPVNWFRLGSARFSRSDLAAEFYDQEVFASKAIGDFGAEPGPAILINATDLARGSRFSFVRGSFDPICSDLSTYPVARAVAASSAVPGLLTPIRMRSYAGTCGYVPEEWVAEALATERPGTRRFVQARLVASYLDEKAGSTVFLMDGGITDNLGIRGPFARAVRQGELGPVLDEGGFGGARAMLLIVVNAQTEPDLDLENTGNLFRSLAMMAGITSGIQIRRFNFETLELVRTSFERWAEQMSSPQRPFGFHMVEVGFSHVRDEERRQLLNNLPTSFALDDEAVDALRATAREVLRTSEDFRRFLARFGSPAP